MSTRCQYYSNAPDSAKRISLAQIDLYKAYPVFQRYLRIFNTLVMDRKSRWFSDNVKKYFNGGVGREWKRYVRMVGDRVVLGRKCVPMDYSTVRVESNTPSWSYFSWGVVFVL